MEEAPAANFEINELIKNQSFRNFKQYKIYYNKSPFDILIGLTKEDIIIKSFNYDKKINKNELSKLTNVIYNSVEELYEFIKNIFEQNKVIIKEVTKEMMKLIIFIYDTSKMKEKEIEINLLSQLINEDYIAKLLDKYSKLEKDLYLIKDTNRKIMEKNENIEKENKILKEENIKINKDIIILKDQINNIFENINEIKNQMINNSQIKNNNNIISNNNQIINNLQIKKDNLLINNNQKKDNNNILNSNQMINNNQTKNITQMKNNNNLPNNNHIQNNNQMINNKINEGKLKNPTIYGDTPGNNIDTKYDVIILGTGLKECILAALLSSNPIRENSPWEIGTKILQLDRNNYYGSESASLNLTNLWKYFRRENEYPKQYGKNIIWNVDLIPKLIMANGSLVKILLKTNVSKYFEWKSVDRSFIYQFDKGGMFGKAKGKIHMVPNTPSEALKSDYIGLFEKNKCKKFLEFIRDYEINNTYTQNGIGPDIQFKDFIKTFGLEKKTVEFIGHAIALYTNDNYLENKAIITIDKLKLYINSFGLYGKSPFIYPLSGLGRLSEGFARLCSLNGGSYILNRDIEEILYDENYCFRGIKSQGEEIYGKILITEPSYVQKFNKVKSIGKIMERICILDHPIPKTNNAESLQIILPQRQINRKNDIFINVFDSTHLVCKKGYYIAIISTIVEQNDDNPISQIKPAMDLIGSVLETFDKFRDIYSPVDIPFIGNIYITSSYDQQSHFENDIDDVINIYEQITGRKLDLNLGKETKTQKGLDNGWYYM